MAIKSGAGVLYCCSAYMPGEMDDPPPTLVREVIQHCEYNDIPLLIGFDANAHNTIWNSSDTNDRGEALYEYLLLTNMFLCNRGHEPTFVTANRREVLDFTLASRHVADEVSDWRVDPTPSLSDHRCIRFKLVERSIPVEVSRNIRNTDWDMFETCWAQALSSLEIGPLHDAGELDQAALKVTKALTEAWETACPPRRVRRGVGTSKWWSASLAASRREIRQARHRAARAGT